MNGPTSIAITGIGLATPLGIGKDGVWSALAKGRIGLTNLTLFKSQRCGVFPVGQVRDDLAALGAPEFGFIQQQAGMFSYSGLSKAQVDRLREEYAIYAIGTGRICVAALNSKNIDYVCQAIAKVI